MSFENIRKDYDKHTLMEADCPADPNELLHRWLHDAHADSDDANAMTLSTVDAQGRPSSRVVLLRRLETQGLSFFTNYASRKGTEMETNAHVALNFFWPEFERQVRVEGVVQKLSEAESRAYFESRPRESQLGAWASMQSSELSSRDELESRFHACAEQFSGCEIPMPPHWGGYVVAPHYFEFWQGRPNRLHDRIAYYKNEKAVWKSKRLSP